MRDYSLHEIMSKLERLRPVSLEEMLTGEEYFGLTTASKLQRAVCRAIDGIELGELASDPDVIEAFGGCVSQPGGKPLEVDILSAIRVGKSLIAAATAVHWTQTCDLSNLRPGDIARVSIVSLTKKNAAAVYSHVVQSVLSSPKLKRLVVGDPTADTIVFRHPSGRSVEVCITAGTRAGGSLVSTWSAGVVFDEYTRMLGDEEGVINYDEMHAAVIGRILPGAQIVSIGSPYGSTGPAYERHAEYFGKKGGRVVVVWAPGWIMNPVFWTKARCEQFKLDDPDAYRTDCEAKFSSPEEAMFPVLDIERARRKDGDLPYEPGLDYHAAMDPATRGNGWTLVIARRDGDKRQVVLVRQWTGTASDPLDVGDVMSDVGALCRQYSVKAIWSDQVLADAIRPFAAREGLSFVERRLTKPEKLVLYTNLKIRLSAGQVELHPDKRLRDDLLRVRKRVTADGAQIWLPKTSDGRHCDFAPSLVLVMSKWMNDAVRQKKMTEHEKQMLRFAKEEEQMWKEALKKNRKKR